MRHLSFRCCSPFKHLVASSLLRYVLHLKPEDKDRIAASLAKIMAMMCVRNTRLEIVHAGVVPVTLAGDYSDVFVVDADGRKIPWADVSHIDDDEMRDLMRQIVNRLYTFHMNCDDPEFMTLIDRWMTVAGKWDDPELDAKFLGSIKFQSDLSST